MMPATQGVQTIARGRIRVDEKNNPRGGPVSAADVAELTKSVKENGILMPVLVSPEEDGYLLVDGYRRMKAAELAGVDEVPFYVKEAGDNRQVWALSANLPGLRKDMNPIAEAKAIADVSNGGKVSKKALAKRLGMSEGWIRARLALLDLPERAQELVAAGSVPIGATGEVAKIAEASPALASRICELVAADEELARELADEPAHVIWAVIEADQVEVEGAPTPEETTVVDVTRAVDVARTLPATAEQREQLLERLQAIRPAGTYDPASVRMDDQDHDALRALGVLIECKGSGPYARTQRFCCGHEALRDVVSQAIEREAKEAEKRLARERKHEAAAKKLAKASGKAAEAISPEEVAKEERRAAYRERVERQDAARTANLELGHKLLRRRSRKISAKRQLGRAKAIAHVVVNSDPDLAARGLRLTREGWQEVEVKTLKNGKTKETVTYVERHAANDRLLEEIDKAASVEAVLELVAEAMVAATYADQAELPGSKRCQGWGVRSDKVVDETIDVEAAGVLPEAMQAKAKDRQEMRAVAAA